MRNVLVGTPSYDGKLDVWYVNSLYQSIHLCMANNINLIPVWMSYDAIITRTRNDIMSIMMEANCDDLLWIDSDIEWNPEWVLKLLSYNEDIVGGTYRKKTDEEELYVIKVKDIINNGLLEVSGLGFGFIKISKKACIDLWESSIEYESGGKKSRNIFEFVIENGELVGEDITVCNKLSKLGYKIYLDTSMTCNHIGNKKYCGDFNNYINRINK